LSVVLLLGHLSGNVSSRCWIEDLSILSVDHTIPRVGLEVLFNLFLDGLGLQVIIIDILELNELVVLEGLSGSISTVSWVINSSLGVDHAIELLNNVLFFKLSVLKILIKDVSSLDVVSIMNQNFFSI